MHDLLTKKDIFSKRQLGDSVGVRGDFVAKETIPAVFIQVRMNTEIYMDMQDIRCTTYNF